MKKLKIILKYKYIFFIILLLITILRTRLNNNSIYDINNTYFEGIITDYEYKENYITFTIKNKEKIKCNYYLNDNNKTIHIKYGDKVKLKGKLTIPKNNTIPNTFNYKKYLNNNNIYYILTIDEIIEIEKNNNILYKIKNIINERIIKFDTKGYLNTFILGNKNYIDEDTYDNYQINGIIHIFSISGMHISILSSVILIILNRIYKNKYNIIIVIIFLSIYLIITNYQASIVRSITFFILLQIFKLKKININTKDTLLIAISIILLIYPKYIFNIGFLYSSIISYTLIFYSNYFNKKYILNTLLISIISFLISLPITVNINYEINLLSIFINILFVPLVSFILYPLALLVLLFPILNFIFIPLLDLTELISNFISKLEILVISIPKLNFIYIIIYYFIVYVTLSKNNKYFILIIYILLLKNINKFDPNYYIYYLDVGQGDMEVIKYKDKTIVIDTGCKSFNSNFEITKNYIKFFNSIGINNIDSLVLSHGDYDHMGEAINLVENFKVEKVIFNCGEFNELEQNLIKVLDKKQIKYYSCIKELNIDNNKLYFLKTRDYGNENDNSSVIYTEINSYKFMFMGDAGVEVEEDLIKKYNLQDIDILKVGHHGSKTSSGEEFINEVNPKYSIISVGKNNRYGHPNNSVLDNLENSKIYRTDQYGSIMFKIKSNKLKIETCSP
ncbi:MAG: DNA internalization-related competence protein ComEC/Rec2 [Bacilli bacterium]|nr:DNA internalization-related competence protein ComEC/Rec2 [Bacilli bacterium]